MRTRTITAGALAALALTLTACSSEEEPTAVNKPTADKSVSAEDKAKAREAAGLPPEPNAEARKAFLDALNAIDSRIIKPGKDDQAVSRGLNQCSSIKANPDDTAKLAESALSRFTIDTRLPEINTPETGQKIVDAVRKHLCPDS
ncbi:hypothetical protein CJI59_13905 [Streptomyces sp. Alain-F2R5]|nr:hypothetical protein [Streptomyces sp. Alain-F2R5]PAN01013.1 hypothetical protein CJI59_13905 [Streptomyces sp. Alain-F2R5]